MKVKDFIKMLQEADPSGEAYVRLPYGGAPTRAELKEGYWDGPYKYVEPINPDEKMYYDNMRIVMSRDGMKVDIGSIDYDDISWEYNGDMNEIMKRVRFDESVDESRRMETLTNIDKQASIAKDYDDKFLMEWYQDVIVKYFDKGYEIRQPLDKPIGYYNSMKAYKTKLFGGEKYEVLNQGECDILIRSGKFYPVKEKKYYVWKHDPEKGRDWRIKK